MFFFFQAEDGIRVRLVTGVQTCALPICVIDTGNRDVSRGRRARIRAVVRDKSDRASDGAGMVAGVSVGDRTQGGLVIGNRIDSGQREHAGCGVVAASDRRGIGERQHVLTSRKTTRDGDRRIGDCAAVNIGERQPGIDRGGRRSEEHTSELQSQAQLVCRLLL